MFISSANCRRANPAFRALLPLRSMPQHRYCVYFLGHCAFWPSHSVTSIPDVCNYSFQCYQCHRLFTDLHRHQQLSNVGSYRQELPHDHHFTCMVRYPPQYSGAESKAIPMSFLEFPSGPGSLFSVRGSVTWALRRL